MQEIKIANRLINEDSPTFIIAEIGVNHNGSVEIAKKLIDAAKDVGADAVKFQTFKTENLVSKSLKDFYEMVKKLELGKEDFKELAQYAKKKDIIFFSTPTDEESADLLEQFKPPVFKIASGDLTQIPFIKYIAGKKTPIILSTGMGNLCEVEEALNAIYSTGNHDVILMHCVSSYPAPIEEVNLKVIHTLEKAFNVPVGFSDHTQSSLTSVIAATMGAKVIEKHFTLDKDMEGPDHKASADVTDFKEIVDGIRSMEKMKGFPMKKMVESEKEIRINYRKSIFAKEKILKGNTITLDNITIKRPGNGIQPKYIDKILGKKVKRDINPDEMIKWDLI